MEITNCVWWSPGTWDSMLAMMRDRPMRCHFYNCANVNEDMCVMTTMFLICAVDNETGEDPSLLVWRDIRIMVQRSPRPGKDRSQRNRWFKGHLPIQSQCLGESTLNPGLQSRFSYDLAFEEQRKFFCDNTLVNSKTIISKTWSLKSSSMELFAGAADRWCRRRWQVNRNCLNVKMKAALLIFCQTHPVPT